MENDFTRLGFLASGTDVSPIIPALEAIWQNSVGKGLSDFNFRSVSGSFSFHSCGHHRFSWCVGWLASWGIAPMTLRKQSQLYCLLLQDVQICLTFKRYGSYLESVT
ncbi:uncharacterized protein LOC131233491 [Magnolia sinica]|uniref:uncharacterized protein LOC131233491 n=1 Tax=Magnolia sinica TaxID=86752 RepID=UPI00265A10D5|nr:uncharacterized protein LOC131233491 [Magnolia sinica]